MTDETSGTMKIDPALVRQLAELLDETRLTEIEVQDGERRIRVAREAAPVAMAPAAPIAAPAIASASVLPVAPDAEHPGTVHSPMVGTVYLSAEPGGPQFAAVGTQVTAGQTLLIVEAMKVMNPIAAPHAGTVKAVLVENGQPVEFDQPLLIVE